SVVRRVIHCATGPAGKGWHRQTVSVFPDTGPQQFAGLNANDPAVCKRCRDPDSNRGCCGHNAEYSPLYDHGQPQALSSSAASKNPLSECVLCDLVLTPAPLMTPRLQYALRKLDAEGWEKLLKRDTVHIVECHSLKPLEWCPPHEEEAMQLETDCAVAWRYVC